MAFGNETVFKVWSVETGQTDQQVIAGCPRHSRFTDRQAVFQVELTSSAVEAGDHRNELDRPLVADVGGHDELKAAAVLTP
ncbi:hypothetical protein [Streptomyces sp. NPDC047999]|uniref:hypothetical protein n=1 Tax=Streptomyces sp. NPDC047999 TaxID=3365497 RepID=UPI003723990F